MLKYICRITLVPVFFATCAMLVTPLAHAAEYMLADGSSITYHVKHPMHDVTGRSSDIKLLERPVYDPATPDNFSGVQNIPVQAPWDGFDSGNANRDANTRLVVKASQFPAITYVIEQITGTTRIDDHSYQGTALGRMYIAGQKNPVTATLNIDVRDPERLRVQAHSRVDMTKFGIDPPKLLLISADKWVRFETDLVFQPALED